MMRDRQAPIITGCSIPSGRIIDCILRASDEVGDVLDLKHGISKNVRWSVDEVYWSVLEGRRTSPDNDEDIG